MHLFNSYMPTMSTSVSISKGLLLNTASKEIRISFIAAVVLCQAFFTPGILGQADASSSETGKTSETTGKSPTDIYKGLLRHKRAAQLEAVQTILNLDKREKQYKIVHLMAEKVISVMVAAKVKLMESGFTPGDPVPEEEEAREAFANTVENTMLLGDILLRLPDITHDILNKNRDWDITLKWALGFVNETGVLSANDKKLLHLSAQELNIIEREENFFNPFSKSNQQEAAVEKEVDDLLQEKIKELEKKRKRREKRKKGPRLSAAHTEL